VSLPLDYHTQVHWVTLVTECFAEHKTEEGAMRRSDRGAKPQRLTGNSGTGIIRFKHRLLHYRRARRTAITRATTTLPTTDIFVRKNARSRFGGEEKWKLLSSYHQLNDNNNNGNSSAAKYSYICRNTLPTEQPGTHRRLGGSWN
jgi:hypothetical protein